MSELTQSAEQSEAGSAVEAAKQIGGWVAAYREGRGPCRRAESLEIGRRLAMRLEKIAGYWDHAEQGLAAAAARRRSEEALKAKLRAAKQEAAIAEQSAEAKQDEVAPAPAQSVAAVEPEAVAPALSEWEIGQRKEAEAAGRLSFILPGIQSSRANAGTKSAKIAEAPEAPPAGAVVRLITKRQAESEPEPAAEPEGGAKPSTALVVPALPALFMAEAEAVKEMNDKHAVISNLGGKCVVMEWAPSAITPGAKELSYQSFASFRERYANRYIDFPDGRGRIESVPRAPFWLSHPQRRQYEGLDLVPNGPEVLPGGYLNLWRGWGVVPRKGSWRLMERHIAEVLADGDQKFEDYIRMLTAWKFQNPGLPPEVVVALLGGKGAGKGVWGYAQMLIWGQHGLQIFSTDHLCGKHNAHLQNKLFLFLDEAMWAGDKQAERVLKGITTEKWMMIEPKNVNAFQWPNHIGILMSGNDKWIVPASHDERRYAVNRISERWKQNRDYFRPLFAEIEGGGAAAMLYDLLQVDLDGWRPSENVPQTRALVEQKMFGLTGLEQWYVYRLGVGELPMPSTKNPRWVMSETLMEDAQDHNPRNKYVTPDELGRFMREMGCEHKSNGKKWGWIFPPLGEAREAWRARAGGTWDWLTPEIADWGQKPAVRGGTTV